MANACSTALSVTSSATRSSIDGVVGSAVSSISAVGVERLLLRMTRSDSLRVVVANHDANRSASRMREQCSAETQPDGLHDVVGGG